MENANLKELIAIDLDGSDNLTEDILFKFINKYGPQLQGNISSQISNPFKTSIISLNEHLRNLNINK